MESGDGGVGVSNVLLKRTQTGRTRDEGGLGEEEGEDGGEEEREGR